MRHVAGGDMLARRHDVVLGIVEEDVGPERVEERALVAPAEEQRLVQAHKRVIRTLREWGIRLDEALFLGGRPKGPFLEAFGADIFFDDSEHNIASARDHVAAGHVPHGVANAAE